jgi:hypothetical protein
MAAWRSPIRDRTIGILFLVMLALSELASAGGPGYVAGVNSFNAGTKGTPLVWTQGTINYYTDQGNLSSLLPGPSADAFVADAFSRWTSISTAAVSVAHAGQLAEDVSGANVSASNGVITMPADILPSAVNQPVSIVYDADGTVTDALLGAGASGTLYCFTNGVFGGPDNLGADAHLLHAMLVLNGNCAQTSSQLPDMKYRLVRALGRVLGLDWSQINVNAVSGQPAPTALDYAGFPVMHAVDPAACIPITRCYPATVDPTQPKMDDQAALSRLYPVTAQNLAGFPGKQIFSSATVRIHGTVYFADADGQPAQPMQGVNVVARWIDPTTGVPSRTFAAASVSGFLFRGNAGNPVTGFNDSQGRPLDRFGSDDPSVEGFFDLAGLQISNGAATAKFELSIEAVDPIWSYGMGPYRTMTVQPSGSTRLFVAANQGQDVRRDVLMVGSALYAANSFGSTTYATPGPVPAAGDWIGSLSPYGDADYFWFPAQANRTLSVSAIALDETGSASQSKAQPVIGMWGLATPEVAPATAHTPSAFNILGFGETRLDATINANTSFRVGIADFRGDGRPDFRYHARVFYGDSVAPTRASAAGGTPLAIRGLGFRQGDSVSIGATSSPLLALSANQFLVNAPAAADGVRNVVLNDPATGGTSTMTGVLTYGAGPNDIIKLISGGGQKAPAGGEVPNSVVVQVLTPDGTVPVAGASVFFTSSPAAALAVCGGASSCTVFSDQNGNASTRVTMLSNAAVTFSAELAPASYNPPATAQTTLSGVSSALDIALAPQSAWIAQGATLSLPLTARALSNGTPLAGRTVNYRVQRGSALPSFSSAVTDANGYAPSTLQISSLAGDLQVSACIQNQPVDAPCLIFNAIAVPASALRLHPVAGTLQVTVAGQSFQPVAVQVTDQATPAHPVFGASVVFQSLVARVPQGFPVIWIGDTSITSVPLPVILASSQISVQSDVNGFAVVQPSSGGVQGPVIVLGAATAGSSSSQFALQSFSPMASLPPAAKTIPVSRLRKDNLNDAR